MEGAGEEMEGAEDTTAEHFPQHASRLQLRIVGRGGGGGK